MKVLLTNNIEAAIYWFHNNWAITNEKKRERLVSFEWQGTICTIVLSDVSTQETIRTIIEYSKMSHKDSFNKKKGREISLTKTINNNFSKEERTLIWDEYNRTINKATKGLPK